MDCLRNTLVKVSPRGRLLLAFTFIIFTAVLSVQTASASPACAGLVPLGIGATVFPGDCTGVPQGTLLATMSAPFSSLTGKIAGTVVSAVYNDGGTLDFLYQITNGTNCTNPNPGVGCDPIIRETDVDFFGFATSVATRLDGSNTTFLSASDPFINGDTLPSTADKNATGDTVGFNFPLNMSDQIDPGHTSVVLIIATNATAFTAGNVNVIDGGTTTVTAFEPTSAPRVPEPTSMALLGSGLVGLAGAVRRRFHR